MQDDIIIRKQRFSITTTSEETALQVRRQLNDTLQYDVITTLQQVFSSYNTGGSYINISKIKVDLGTMTSAQFEQDFTRLLAPKLVLAIQEQLQVNSPAAEETQAHKTATQAAETQAHKTAAQAAEKSATAPGLSHKHQQLTALIFFLQNGILPWWHKAEKQTPAVILESILEDDIDPLLLKLFEAIQTGAKQVIHIIAARLFNYLPPSRYTIIIDRLIYLLNDQALSRNMQVLQKEAPYISLLFSISPQAYHTQLFAFALQQKSTKNFGVTSFLQHLQATFGIHPHPTNEREVSNLSPALAAIFTPLIAQAKINEEKQEKTHRKPKITNTPADAQTSTTSPSISPLAQEGLFIGNAGLIILHPFLQPLFHALNLLDEQHQFIAATDKYKAAVVLFYLQCGSLEYQEWEMVLNKILCSIPLEEVLPNDIVLTEHETDECNALLQMVVNYWEALKGAGIEAVQQTFFVREGKLTFKQDYWLLQVERTGTDILLDRLPWGFTTIKLPWLPNLIYTEW